MATFVDHKAADWRDREGGGVTVITHIIGTYTALNFHIQVNLGATLEMNFTQELSLLMEGRMTNVWTDAAALSLPPTHLLLLTHCQPLSIK